MFHFLSLQIAFIKIYNNKISFVWFARKWELLSGFDWSHSFYISLEMLSICWWLTCGNVTSVMWHLFWMTISCDVVYSETLAILHPLGSFLGHTSISCLPNHICFRMLTGGPNQIYSFHAIYLFIEWRSTLQHKKLVAVL